jgi:cellulose synthase (UDP-forming)
VKALFMALLKRKASWTATNAGSGGLPGVELVLPHVALLLVNLMAVVVGVNALTMRGADTTGIMLSLVWASIYVLVLGRVVGEAVFAPRHFKERLERRKAGARLSRALPWPSRTEGADEVIDLTVEQTSRPTSPAQGS